MEGPSRIPLHDCQMASRKAEEAALRRYQAAAWLEMLVGPLGLPNNPSEPQFLSCLRNGLVLCKAINKIQPGSVPKVVESHSHSLPFEFQPLRAYQHFENVRNFLVAVEELKLPAFEASDLERDTREAGSAAKIVDCVLALKCYGEWKEWGGNNGSWKHARSPIVSQSVSRMHSRAHGSVPPEPCRRLDMSIPSEKQQMPLPTQTNNRKPEDCIHLFAKAVADSLLESKENVNMELMNSFCDGKLDSLKSMTKILTSYMQAGHINEYAGLEPVLKNHFVEGNSSFPDLFSMPAEKLSSCKFCIKKGQCNHWRILEAQDNELMEIKSLLSTAKNEFKALQFQFHGDLAQLGTQVQGLSTAALQYHQVVKENRNLYNTIQDLKGNIRVFCRIRPTFNNKIRSTIDYIGDDGSLIILDPLRLQKDSLKSFQFNKVFGPTATQEDVFKDTRPLIRSVMDGYNVCIFAYGQTGSGKTYTMCGPPSEAGKDMGINYMALNDLFEIASSKKAVMKYKVQVQMVEIYNEQVRDLLTEGDTTVAKLEIRNCTSNGGLALPDANMHPVQSTMDVLNLMKLGEKNRAISTTAVNDRSSRSHSVLTVHVQGKVRSSGAILHSCLHLVDLAGSERVDKSEVTGDRLKEAQHINKSLSCLGDVITALALKNPHIPYRNSKLTQLLQSSLGCNLRLQHFIFYNNFFKGGNAKTLMFAHVSPEADSYGETISTLKFAQRVSTVELGTARINKESSEVRELKEQIESLKKALARKEEGSAVNCMNVPRSPNETMIARSEQTTPPRVRRLSIENPRVRRMSIENPGIAASAADMNLSHNKKISRTSVKPKMKKEETPKRLRLSLGDTKHENDQVQIKKADDVHLMTTNIPQPSQIRLLSDIRNINANKDGQCTPSSATTAQGRTMKFEGRSRVPLDTETNTPEPSILMRKADELPVEGEDGSSFIRKSQADPSSVNSKGSHIRKSLQTIGKLIHRQERRIRQPLEVHSPLYTKFDNRAKSPLSEYANARKARRQSLTGVQEQLDARRKPSDSYSKRIQNARTPPPIRSLAMVEKQWL